MESFAEKHRNILLDITANIFVLGVILLLLHYFTSVIVSTWIGIPLLAIITFAAGFCWIFVFIQKDEEYFKIKLEPYFENLFLAGLVAITIGSWSCDFVENNYILESIVSFLYSIQFYLILVTIGLGFFSFYFSKKRIEMRVGLEKKQEVEDKRQMKKQLIDENIYVKKFNLKCEFCKSRAFVQGKLHNTGLTLVLSLFFVTRLYENNFINGSDNYNVLGIKNMYENGISFYKYSFITDFLMLKVINVLDFNIFTIKVPFIIYSLVTLIFIYLICRLINKDLALLSSLLYTLSPWTIIQSRITRDYSFDLMIGSIVLYLCFILYRRITNSIGFKNYVKYMFLFLLIPLSILILYKFNRQQTLTVGIYALITFLFIIESILRKKVFNKEHFSYIYWACTVPFLLIALYFLKRFPFRYGFNRPNFIFLDIFFNPTIESPWQWFNNINMEPFFLLALFFVGIFSLERSFQNKRYILLLFTSFVFTLLLYTLKYESHVDYTPVRYIYFLFIPYVIILSNAILNILNLFETNYKKLTLIVLLITMVNPTTLVYSINPLLAYQEEGISNVQADNIGIGRFKMLEVVSYLKADLNVNNSSIIVFDGRYGEFILYLNRPMDGKRSLLRDNGIYYDISENTYVQSSYFGWYELKKAVNYSSYGIYVTTEKSISNEHKKVEAHLQDRDFYIYETPFEFMKNINGYKIYTWNSTKNNTP